MIFAFDLHPPIYMRLLKDLPLNTIRLYKNPNDIRKHAKEGDMAIIFNWGNAGVNLSKFLSENGIDVFPSHKLTEFVINKTEQLKTIDSMSDFPLKREYGLKNNGLVPDFGGTYTVVKTADEHQGLGKQLLASGSKLSRVNTYKHDYYAEEYVPAARSIRILAITKNIEDIYIVEHVNSMDWIKNVNPEQENVYTYKQRKDTKINNIDQIIADSLKIMEHLDVDFVGLDYVVTEDRTGILEINHMIGLPDNNLVMESAYHYIHRLCSENIR